MTPLATSQLTDRTLNVMEAVAALGDGKLVDIAEHSALPVSTVHRVLQSLVQRGYVIPVERGRYMIGTAVLRLARNISFRDLLRETARPIIAQLARQCRTHAHLGVLEDEMVTYLVKEKFGRQRLITVEGMQLEAYCSAIGKILLAHLPEDRRERYLDGGPFVPLTPNTIVESETLRGALSEARAQGWASEAGEFMAGLHCIAVPVFDGDGGVCAALSASVQGKAPDGEGLRAFLPHLQQASTEISGKLFPGR